MSHQHVPQPVGWKVLVKPIEPKNQTEGGIYLPDESRDAEEYLVSHGYIVSMGEMAYHDRVSGRCWKGDWPCVEDHVTFGKYAGQRVIANGEKYLLLNDDEITSIIPQKCEVTNYV